MDDWQPARSREAAAKSPDVEGPVVGLVVCHVPELQGVGVLLPANRLAVAEVPHVSDLSVQGSSGGAGDGSVTALHQQRVSKLADAVCMI